jgi:hypothetical protein
MTPDRTAAAIEARRRAAEQKLGQVRDAIAWLRRGKMPVTYPAVARRAAVSRTFLYENPDARTLMEAAGTAHAAQQQRDRAQQVSQAEASWRERALTAEDALKAAHAEIRAQRARIGQLLGQLRDAEREFSTTPSSGLPPRTARSSNASASSPPTTGPSGSGWRPLAPTYASLTAASPSSKPS